MGLDDYDEDLSVGGVEYEEALPFAIHDENTGGTSEIPFHSSFGTTSSARPAVFPEQYRSMMKSMMSVSLSSYNDNYYNSNQQAPGLASSMISDSSAQGSSSLMSNQMSQVWEATSASDDHMLSSRDLDAAASLMEGMEGSLAISHGLTRGPRTPPENRSTHGNNGRVPAAYSSMRFSQLMENAAGETRMVYAADGALPALPEETVIAGSSYIEQSFHSARGGDSSSFPSNIPTTTSQSMPSDWVPVSSNQPIYDSKHSQSIHGSKQGSYQPPVLEESHRGGQTISNSRSRRRLTPPDRNAVQARRLDATSFEVSVEIEPGLTVEDVMEVVGNPSYLSLWCESIRSLVITKSSEGARNAANRRSLHSGRARAEYEGEWIEATATDLISPPSASSCLYSTSKAMWNYVGFPTNYGSVSMFVERRRGRVGLTVGPFAGNVTAAHTISVVKEARSTRIVDRVTLGRGMGDSELMCGVLECLETCLLPTSKAYMDQVVSSLIRLRVLVETAEGRHTSLNQFDDDDFELIVPVGIV
ncbi:expressed unknown protein [Seminavis robusta]|uniref:Uncharacterized protein n=1 Tax=Seminavis robusta TaxID=568900 RepID=A0A9N8ERU6_9STRA|nr:expressed unknown protein [Seminavis robusta]|eukprot:Sro1917_g305320.1 n/a (531) ;mRNA; r:9274-10866